MEHSEDLNEIAAALCAAQGEFEAVAKDSENPFFHSKYAGLPKVVKAATPILAKHGLAVSQFPGHDDGGHTLTTMVLHTSGQFLADTMRLRPVKDEPQALGSATTYGRRYSYMAALGLVADEDDDGNVGSGKAAAAPARAVQKQLPERYTDWLRLAIRARNDEELADEVAWRREVDAASTQEQKQALVDRLEAVAVDLDVNVEALRDRWLANKVKLEQESA